MKTTLMIAATLGLFTTTSAFAQIYSAGQIVFNNNSGQLLAFRAQRTDNNAYSITSCFSSGAQGFNWESVIPQNGVTYTVSIATCRTNRDPDNPAEYPDSFVASSPAASSTLLQSTTQTSYYDIWDCDATKCTPSASSKRHMSHPANANPNHPYKAPVKK